jgi:hypothetical protein
MWKSWNRYRCGLDKAEPWLDQWERGREPKWGQVNVRRGDLSKVTGRREIAGYMEIDKKYNM